MTAANVDSNEETPVLLNSRVQMDLEGDLHFMNVEMVCSITSRLEATTHTPYLYAFFWGRIISHGGSCLIGKLTALLCIKELVLREEYDLLVWLL